jgi:threonine synthase
MPSAFSYLRCPECGQKFDTEQIQSYCHDCESPITAVYDLQSIRQVLSKDEIRKRPRGL